MSDELIHIPVRIEGTLVPALIDSGADYSFIRKSVVDSLGLEIRKQISYVSAFDQHAVATYGTCRTILTLENDSETQNFLIDLHVIRSSPADVVIGKTFLNSRAIVNFVTGSTTFISESEKLKMSSPVEDENNVNLNLFSIKGSQDNKKSNIEKANSKESSEMKEVTDGNEVQQLCMSETRDLFDEFASLFNETDKQTFIPDKVMNIDTGSNDPIKLKARMIKPEDVIEINKQVNNLLEKGIIEVSDSPWSFEPVLVRKKDNSRRLCVDYRKLNLITKRDCYPIPRMEALLSCHRGKKIFSTIDLKNGFHHLKLDNDDKLKTAFRTPKGLYQYVGAPFGLKNTPSIFQRCMDDVLKPVAHLCQPYIDDIVVSSFTVDEHLKQLREIFNCLKNNNIILNRKKCNFLQSSVGVLGHVVDETGIRPSPEKLFSIVNFATPTCIKDVRSFLGKVSYVAKFFNNISKALLPLRKLVRKGSKFDWKREEEDCFQLIKELVSSSKCHLIHADPSAEKVVVVKSDSDSVACAIYQKNGKELELLEHKSRLLSSTESRYCEIEREALAVELAFDRSRMLLEGPITVQTTLPHFKTAIMKQNLPARLIRILLSTQEFDYSIELVKPRDELLFSNQTSNDQSFEPSSVVAADVPEDLSDYISVYIDGSCVKNGCEDASGAYGIFWSENNELNRSVKIDDSNMTNQKAELVAAVEVLKQCLANNIKKVKIYSDSAYLVNSRLDWCKKWKENGYQNRNRKAVSNLALHQTLDQLCETVNVLWVKVPGHSGVHGNEEADKLAKQALGLPVVKLSFVTLTEQLISHQSTDPAISSIVNNIDKKPYRFKYIIKNKLLYRIKNDQELLVVPKVIRPQVLHQHHDNATYGSHRGVHSTYLNILAKYWWKSLKKDVIAYVTSCHQCQLFKPDHLPYGNLKPITRESPMDLIGLDFVGPLPTTASGHRFVVIAVDYFSKWTFTKPLVHCTAGETAKFILNDIVYKYGVPKCIISDQGPQFRSALLTSIAKTLGIQKLMSTPYHPEGNGLTERTNATIMRSLKYYVNNHQNNWDDHLAAVTACYNKTVHSSTGLTPYQVLFGKTPNDEFKEISSSQTADNEYVATLQQNLQNVANVVRENGSFARMEQKISFDNKHKLFDLVPGDLVLEKKHRRTGSKKFDHSFSGPFIIKSVVNDGRNVILQINDREKLVAITNVKKYNKRADDLIPSQSTLINHHFDVQASTTPILPSKTPTNLILKSLAILSIIPQNNNQAAGTAREVLSQGDFEMIGNELDQADSDSDTIVYFDANDEQSTTTCSICQRTYSSRASLLRHSRMHTGELPYQCRKCLRLFRWQTSHRRHSQLRHPLKFPCGLCSFQYTSEEDLEEHRRECHNDA